jgi:haloalkane dehalogenase
MPGKPERSFAERRLNLQAGLFPFESRFLDADGARVHYIDEGSGPTLVLLHGNPSWSFVYRHVIRALRGEFRCVALDLPGFGLSEPPPGYGYTPAEHAGIVATALGALDVRDACLVAHDWGGPIGLRAMLDTGSRISRVVLGNTWAWPVNGDLHFEWFSRLMGGPIGRWGNRRFCLFVNGVLPASMRRGKPLPEVMQAYRAPFDPPRMRTPLSIFPAQILGARDWLGALAGDLEVWTGPASFLWPDDDIAVRARELARWQKMWPHATAESIPRCGHFLWEDAPDDAVSALRKALGPC